MSPRSNRKTSTWSAVNFKKTLDLDELLTWARDMVLWYWSADTLFWQVSVDHNVDVQYQRSTQLSLSTCYLECGCHVARRRRRRRAYVPMSNTASHENHEKINSWILFCFPYMGCLWGSAWRPFGPPDLRYELFHICFTSFHYSWETWTQ